MRRRRGIEDGGRNRIGAGKAPFSAGQATRPAMHLAVDRCERNVHLFLSPTYVSQGRIAVIEYYSASTSGCCCGDKLIVAATMSSVDMRLRSAFTKSL